MAGISTVSEGADTSSEPPWQALQLLADIASPAIAYLDTRLYFQMSNEAFKRRFGCPDHDTRASDFFVRVGSPEVNHYLQSALERGRSLSTQVDWPDRKSSAHHLGLRVVPYGGPNRIRGLFLACEEIAHRAVESGAVTGDTRKDRAADTADRTARAGAISADLTHELRQPLSAIGNYAYALRSLLRADRSSQEILPLVEQIVDQAKRAEAILADACK